MATFPQTDSAHPDKEEPKVSRDSLCVGAKLCTSQSTTSHNSKMTSNDSLKQNTIMIQQRRAGLVTSHANPPPPQSPHFNKTTAWRQTSHFRQWSYFETELEQQGNGYQYNKVAAAKAAKAMREPVTYHRPGPTHKYLMATEKRPRTAGYDGEYRLGRPTRTTLLRARQRCNSAPITSYESRQEQQRRVEQQTEMKKQYNQQTNQSLTDLLSANIPAGESLHSYLIGARYNSLSWIRGLSLEDLPRAHHFDDKSLKEYGVYLPRYSNGPAQNCFVIKKMKLKQRESQDEHQENEGQPPRERPATAIPYSRRSTPQTPQTPRSNSQPATSPVNARRPSHSKSLDAQPSLVITPQPNRNPPVPGRQAWSEKPHNDVNGNAPSAPSDAPPPISIEVAPTNDGISIKSVGFIGSPPKVARPTTQNRHLGNRSSPNGSDPSVMIQGRSIHQYNIAPTPVRAPGSTPLPKPVSVASSAPTNTPRASRPKSSVGPRRQITARDVSFRMQEEEEQTIETSLPEESDEVNMSPEGSISEDMQGERVELMSTGSDEDLGSRLQGPSPSPAASPLPSPSSSPRPDPSIAPLAEAVQEEQSATESASEPLLEPTAPVEEPLEIRETQTEIGMERLTPIILNPKRAVSAKTKKAHVRFADQVVPEDSPDRDDPGNKSDFFITNKVENTDCPDALTKTDNAQDTQNPSTEPTIPSLMVDSGDVLNVVSEPMQADVSSLKENSTDSLNNGSGDSNIAIDGNITKTNGLAHGLLSPAAGMDEADSASVASEDHSQPVKVISVDIVQKVPPDNT